MHIGVLAQWSDVSLDAATMARMVEEAGFESLFAGEHSHIPASRESPYPGSKDGTLPAGYERTLDLIVVLTVAALATTRLRIGTGILQIVERDPIHTAKAIASIDYVSGGRTILITGSSWNLEEMRNHGTDPATRYELLEERVAAMREIWTRDEATFHGEFVNFDRIWSWPKPVQDRLPVFIGGNSDGVEDRALRVGTGWAPLYTPGITERIRAYLAHAAQEGVETAVTAVGGELSPALIEDYAKAGAERWLHSIRMTDSVEEFADRLEALQAAHAQFAGTP